VLAALATCPVIDPLLGAPQIVSRGTLSEGLPALTDFTTKIAAMAPVTVRG
jgi:hypothetical protein